MKWTKRIIIFLLPGFLIFGGYRLYKGYQWKQEEKRRATYWENIKDTASPTVSVLKDEISIGYRDAQKTLHVYLPPSYATDTLRRYPVIYMLDGGGCFNDTISAPEWQLDEVIDAADLQGKASAIVIGIPSAENRDAEYTPWINDDNPDAHGERFANWMAHDLKAWVDSTYRTDPSTQSTTIGGISRSGMMAYYMVMAHSEVYGNAIIQSPAMWVDYDRLMEMEISDKDLASSKKIFVSVGEHEGNVMIPHAEAIYDKFKVLGLGDNQVKYHLVPGEGHWNLTWRLSFAEAYPWMMGL